MTDTHDPVQQIGWLQQCLRSNKRQVGFLFGAGCSMAIRTDQGEPLIPDIREMTKQVVRILKERTETKADIESLTGQFSQDGTANPTVEDFLTRIRSLRAVAGKGEVRGLNATSLDRLDARICDVIHELTNKPHPRSVSPYHSLAKWADGKRRGCPVEVFTTNYDLLIEQAFEDQSVPYFDGFAGVRRPFFDLRAMEEDVIPSRWARLWKLHGSINWFQDAEQRVWRGPVDSKDGNRRVIHPSHQKYHESRRLPYLAMMDRLRSYFRHDGASLVVCGYSFRDEHINEIIVQGLRSNPSSVAFGLQFDSVKDIPEARKLALGQENLNLFAKDVGVIGGKELPWPEKAAEAAAESQSPWIEWKPKNATATNEPHLPSFKLGDFAVFGKFLAELAGANAVASGETNGR
ncbi:MAG: SIR2 family protein [Planctomycetota bacterium]|nr:SIR2 family protein [Planctomycetota bacterium]GIK51427.1 MAG: SIR2 family protein [Planctomycetota bacterium]